MLINHFFNLNFFIKISFFLFCFSMFSAAPTGLINSFFWFACIGSCILAMKNGFRINFLVAEKVGIILFGSLAISIFWTRASFPTALENLLEYRLWILLPLLSFALSRVEYGVEFGLAGIISGGAVAAVASVGLGHGLWEIGGATLSLAERILHGFTMAIYVATVLVIARFKAKDVRVLAFLYLSGFTAVYSVLAIEIGRTGYLQTIACLIVFFGISCNNKSRIIGALVGCVGFLAVLLVSDTFIDRVLFTLSNVQRALIDNDFQSSAGYRLAFYSMSLELGLERPWFGFGIGSVGELFRDKYAAGEFFVLTDNVHNEFLSIFLSGGVVSLMLFLSFIFFSLREGWFFRNESREIFVFVSCVSTVLIIGCAFNSSLRDFGDKHVFLAAISIVFALIKRRLASPEANATV